MKLKYTLAALAALSTMSAQALPIKKSEAREIAQTFIGINDTTADDDTYCPYYIFSRGSGKGFVIVSGDDSTTPILGYTDQGDYVKGGMPEPLNRCLRNGPTASNNYRKPILQGLSACLRHRRSYSVVWLQPPATPVGAVSHR